MAAISTGHIVSDLASVPAEKRVDYRLIPLELQSEADRALAGKAETIVDVKGKTPLASWMRSERAADKRKAKAKKRKRAIVAKSRRRNRKQK